MAAGTKKVMLGSRSVKLAVCISGRGGTLANLLDQGFCVRVVFSTNPKSPGLALAEEKGIFTVQLPPPSEGDKHLFQVCRNMDVDLVVLGGFLRKLVVPEDFLWRVMNIHPSLLPAFGGQGMWGERVHEAVLNRGCKVTGCTVHFVDHGEYDSGPIVLQKVVPVLEGDDASILAARVFEAEKEAYPAAIRLYQEGRLRVQQGRVTICEPFE